MRLLLIILALFILPACSTKQKELVFATYTYSTNNRLTNLQPLADWLSEQTGVKIKAVSYPTVQSLIDAIRNDSVDMAMINTSGYLVLQRKYPGIVYPAVNLYIDGSGVTNYGGCIIAAKDSGLLTMADLGNASGKPSLALVSSSSTSGNLVPRLLLNSAGVSDAESKFNVYYAGTHRKVVEDVLTGKAAAGGCGCAEIDTARSKGFFDDKAIVVSEFNNTPLGPIVFSNKMNRALSDVMMVKLLAVHGEEPEVFKNFCAGWTEFKKALHFSPVSDVTYNEFRQMFGSNEGLWKMIE
jgi:phosphonate transport system substrate-binding protein